MSFSVDSYGINAVTEVKAYNKDFSTTMFLKTILNNPGDVYICTYSLPSAESIYPMALSVRSNGVTIIANSKFEYEAKALKQQFPQVKIYLHPKAHAKMILAPGHVWIGSANLTNCHAMEGTIGIASPVVHAFYMDELQKSGALDVRNMVTLDSSNVA